MQNSTVFTKIDCILAFQAEIRSWSILCVVSAPIWQKTQYELYAEAKYEQVGARYSYRNCHFTDTDFKTNSTFFLFF